MRLETETASKRIPFRQGQEVLLRLLRSDDAQLLGEYFLGLSAATTEVYGPHSFDQETADRLCAAIDSDDMVRVIAVLDGRIIGYFIIACGVRDSDIKRYIDYDIELLPVHDCALAPSLADDCQGEGLGPVMLAYCRDISISLGFERMVLSGGVRVYNARALAFYEKTGFRRVGYFERPGYNSYDMIANLADIP